MKNDALLTVGSLLSVLFVAFHLSDEIARGMERGGLNAYPGRLAVRPGGDRGHIITLVGSIVGTGIPILHMAGKGLAGGRVSSAAGSERKNYWAQWRPIPPRM
jgi:hypothetical protein